MSTTPPPAWRDAVGNALAAAWQVDQSSGDFYIARAWEDERLAKLPPDEAAAAFLAMERERNEATDAEWLASGHTNACIIWRRGYIQEWEWLTCGECDFENPDGEPWLTELWQTHPTENPAAVARSDFEKTFTAEKQETYRTRREAALWKPR